MDEGLKVVEGPLTSVLSVLKIQKVNRVFAGTIGPSTGDCIMLRLRVSSSCDSSSSSTFSIVNTLSKGCLLDLVHRFRCAIARNEIVFHAI